LLSCTSAAITASFHPGNNIPFLLVCLSVDGCRGDHGLQLRGGQEADGYLKIDFYHAGVGRVFPFIMPMTTVDKYIYRPLFLSNDGDVEELKKGVPMSDLNRQMFIPVNLIYNDENKRYVYYLPDNYRENSITETDNNIMEFNLFEVKIKNESNETNY
jgi:hypothetical protein